MSNIFDGVEDDFNRSHVFTLSGFDSHPADDDLAFNHPAEWMIQSLELLADVPECEQNRFAPLCAEYRLFGVHFIDRIFGADVFFSGRTVEREISDHARGRAADARS